ncbi:MAG: hypothetical protein ABI488_05190 [Polyangiaceae bacterium]
MIGVWVRGCAWFGACTALTVGGCKGRPSDAAPATAASVTPPAPSASAPAPPAKPWFSGRFSGEYQAKLAPVEIKTGAVKEWAADDGKASSGPGKLTLQIDDDGLVDGSGEGAFGPSQATGKVEDDTLRVSLTPSDATGLHGTLVASRDGDGFKGILEASSGDSLRVRSAAVELKKQPN